MMLSGTKQSNPTLCILFSIRLEFHGELLDELNRFCRLVEYQARRGIFLFISFCLV